MRDELNVGSVAPDFRLSANDGREIRLVDFRDEALAGLFFVREYNRMQCRSHIAQLGRLYEDFQAAGAEMLMILGARPNAFANTRDCSRHRSRCSPILIVRSITATVQKKPLS